MEALTLLLGVAADLPVLVDERSWSTIVFSCFFLREYGLGGLVYILLKRGIELFKDLA